MSLPPGSPQRGRPKPPLIDEWSTREKLALASSVSKSGDQNWHSTSRPLRGFAELNRPADWFSQKNCALQYEDMLEKVEQPKRKRGERGEETAQDVIVRDLTQKRLDECRKMIAAGSENLKRLDVERKLLASGKAPPELLKQIWQRKLDAESKAKEDQIKHQEWLKDRDKKIAAAKIATRQTLLRPPRTQPAPLTVATPPVVIKVEDTSQSVADTQDESSAQSATDSTAPTTPVAQNPPLTSPLLTSLLQSPSGPTTPYKEAKEAAVSPAKIATGSAFFSNQALASATARQLAVPSQSPSSSSTSPVKVAIDESQPVQAPSASPTLSKLLEMPLSSASANKLPPLPGSEKSEEQSSDAPPEPDVSEASREADEVVREDAVDEPRATVKVEQKDDEKSEDLRTDLSKSGDTQEIKTPLTRRQRELRGRLTTTPALAVVATVAPAPSVTAQAAIPAAVTPVASSTVASSSASVATRRSGRIRGIRESESESSVPDKKPSLTDDPILIDASASEESMDAVTKTNVSSKAPSVADSIPNSPASTMHSEDTDVEREKKRWQRSVLKLLKEVVTHKYAHVFLHPAHIEVGNNYNETVKRPLDLMSIKKRVENQSADNAIRTTAEFQREMLLLFQNAVMYNKKGHDVHEMALEMQKEIGDAVEDFVLSERQLAATVGQPSTSGGGKTCSGTETPAAPKQRVRDRRVPASAATPSQTLDDAASRRRSRTSTDTDPGSSKKEDKKKDEEESTSIPLTRTALKKKVSG